MKIFAKTEGYTAAREAQAAGVYPYFAPIQEATPTTARIGGEWKIMVGSNNYLGLTHHPRVLEAAELAMRKYGSGSTGSRFLNGTLDLHDQLEHRLAEFLGKEAGLVFTTGYQTNLGAVGTLVGRDDHLFLDKLDHASIVDGSRMALGTVHRYSHGNLGALYKMLSCVPQDAGKLVATDGVFSMEGSIVDLPGVLRTAKAHGAAVLVDDAHALGVIGERGAGTASHYGLEKEVDLITATFSKSLASVGGVLVGPRDVIHWIRHHSRALIFTASMPPASVAGVLAALDIMLDEPERRERLWHNTRRVQRELKAMGFDLGGSETPIIPVLIGELYPTLRAWRTLFDAGIFTHPIVPPAVPPNSCRIRISMTAEHTDEQLDRVLEAFGGLARMLETPVAEERRAGLEVGD